MADELAIWLYGERVAIVGDLLDRAPEAIAVAGEERTACPTT